METAQARRPPSWWDRLLSRRLIVLWLWLPVVSLSLALGALLLATTRNPKNGTTLTGAGSATAETAANTVEVRRGSIKKTLILSGELRAVRSQSIFALTSEETKITYLPPEGTVVKAGDRLVELDSTTVLTKIKDIDEKIVAAENEMVKTQSTGESALRDMAIKLSQLWLPYEKAKVDARIPAGIEDRRAYQQKQLDLAKTKAEYEAQLKKIEDKKKEQAAELEVKTIEKQKLKIQMDQARADLAGMNIKAPADGMVIYANHWAERRKIQVGDVVWGGFPIVTLPDLSAMEVLARVNEVDGPKLSEGQKATVLLDSYPDRTIGGAVKDISQTAVKANWMAKARIFNVVITLDKTITEIMKPGMSAQITVEAGDYRDDLLVPRAAVQFGGGAPQVVRSEGAGGKKRAIAITIKAADPFYYAVADNGALKEGDRIVE
jgi:HlyD family secretion protein